MRFPEAKLDALIFAVPKVLGFGMHWEVLGVWDIGTFFWERGGGNGGGRGRGRNGHQFGGGLLDGHPEASEQSCM